MGCEGRAGRTKRRKAGSKEAGTEEAVLRIQWMGMCVWLCVTENDADAGGGECGCEI